MDRMRPCHVWSNCRRERLLKSKRFHICFTVVVFVFVLSSGTHRDPLGLQRRSPAIVSSAVFSIQSAQRVSETFATNVIAAAN